MLLGCINGVYASTIEMAAIVNYNRGNSMAGTPDSIDLTKCSSYTVNTCVPAKPMKEYFLSNKNSATDSLIYQIKESCGVDDSAGNNMYPLCKMKIIINKKGDITKLISAERVGEVPETE